MEHGGELRHDKEGVCVLIFSQFVEYYGWEEGNRRWIIAAPVAREHGARHCATVHPVQRDMSLHVL